MSDIDTEENTKLGRPTKYDAEFVKRAKLCGEAGYTDRQVAEHFGIHFTTLYDWKKDHPDFSLALKVGKESADERVVKSLYNRAVGYSFDSEKIMTLTERDGDSSSSHIERVPTIEHVPPDVTACIFWLKNRRPQEWRDRVEQVNPDIKDIIEFSLKIGKAAGAIEERKRGSLNLIGNGRARDS
jgi:hypothetical protein